MSDGLDTSACWAKIHRAREHIAGLETAWQEWLDSEPAGLIYRRGKTHGQWNVTFVLESYPPLRLGVILGDIVHNLGSALDHLVARAVEASGETVRTQHAFPICRTRAEYRKVRERRLAGIPTNSPFRTIVADAQPFGSGAPGEDPLTMLKALWNADKHRTVAARLIYGQQADILGPIEWEPANATITSARWPHLQDSPLEDHTLLATLEVDPADAQPHRRPETIDYILAFGDAEPARVDIREIVDMVQSIVERAGQEWSATRTTPVG